MQSNNFLINEETIGYLDNIIKKRLFANGYIFYGAEGLGKKQAAFTFIKGILKTYGVEQKIEKKINNNNHPDLLIVESTQFIKGSKTKNVNSELHSKGNSEVIKVEQIKKKVPPKQRKNF